MRRRPLTKALIVALPTGLWVAIAQPSLATTIALALGSACVSYAWMTLRARPTTTASPARPGAARGCSRHNPRPAHCGSAQHQIARTPTGRSARDVRCPASRATARTRRSTRR